MKTLLLSFLLLIPVVPQRGQNAAHLYTASASFTLPTGSALNDFWTFTGSATKTVYVTSLIKQCSAASSATNWTNVMVRRTSETGGTFTAWTATPYDKLAPAATAVVGDYSAGVTTGNSGGSVFLQRYVDRLPVNNTTTFLDILRDNWGGTAKHRHQYQQYVDFGYQPNKQSWRPTKPLVLRGTNDIIALTTSFSPAVAISCKFVVSWYEL